MLRNEHREEIPGVLFLVPRKGVLATSYLRKDLPLHPGGNPGKESCRQIFFRRHSKSSPATPRHFCCYKNMTAAFKSLRK